MLSKERREAQNLSLPSTLEICSLQLAEELFAVYNKANMLT